MAFYLYLFSSCLPVLAGMSRASLRRSDTKLLYILLVVGLVFTLLEVLLGRLHKNNLWLFHLYRIMSQYVFTKLFVSWAASPIIQKLIKTSFVVFAVFWCVSKFTIEPFSGWDTYSSTLSNILLVAMSVYMLFSLVQPFGSHVILGYQIGIAAAVLIGSVGDSLVFAFGNTFVQLGRAQARQLYTIHWLVTTFANLVLSWAFLAASRKEHDVPSVTKVDAC